jgi:hypothetical protein
VITALRLIKKDGAETRGEANTSGNPQPFYSDGADSDPENHTTVSTKRK